MRDTFSLILIFVAVTAIAFLVFIVVIDYNSLGPPDSMIENMVRGTIGVIGLGILRFAAGIISFVWSLVYVKALPAMAAKTRE